MVVTLNSISNLYKSIQKSQTFAWPIKVYAMGVHRYKRERTLITINLSKDKESIQKKPDFVRLINSLIQLSKRGVPLNIK